MLGVPALIVPFSEAPERAEIVIPSIRPYTDEDLDALVAIELEAFPSAWSRETLAAILERVDADCRVLEEEERVVGFVIVLFEAAGLHMANLAVAHDCRRRGLALGALEHVDELARARGAGQVYLEVRESNLAAQLLYQKAGYSAVGIAPGFYGDEDAYRMLKNFGG
jgi:ribosomal-protein-alanine N-acetyltransferase